MDRPDALRLTALLLPLSGLLAFVSVEWSWRGGGLWIIPWVLVVGGPFALLVVHPHLARRGGFDGALATMLPALAAAFAIAEGGRVAARALGAGPVHVDHILVNALWVLATLPAAVVAAQRLAVPRRVLHLFVIFTAAAVLEGGTFALGLVFFFVEAAAALPLLGLERTWGDWLAAAAWGAGCFLASVALLIVAYGDLLPPRLIIGGENAFFAMLGFGAAFVAGFLGRLLRPWRRRTAKGAAAP